MRYTSTRNSSISCSFEQALCSGYAPDGGLFVPETLPVITPDLLESWKSLSYSQLVEQVLRLFISNDEISREQLQHICEISFADFPDPAIPIRPLNDHFFVAELFHGPTFCFKDLGMRVVINLLSHFATLRQQRTTLIVSTTGDTGPAAALAVATAHNPLLTLLVHYPHGQISNFQRKQLTTVETLLIQVVAFEGGGDDMDAPIKRMLAHPTTTSTSKDTSATESTTPTSGGSCCWTGVNSYNIGRPLVQMVHFIWTYLRVCELPGNAVALGDPNHTVDIILPTGAMGNIAGGYMAKQMGLPLGKLCAAVNQNDITDRVMQTGVFEKSPVMHKTLSEAINIQIPYNFERLLFYLTNQNHDQVQQWMTVVADSTATSTTTLHHPAADPLNLKTTEWWSKLQHDFSSASVTDEEMCSVMRQVLDQHDYLIDPHTAIAFGAAEKLGYDFSKPTSSPADDETSTKKLVALLSTASPCKFQEAVTIAIGEEGWNTYRQSPDFPVAAAELLHREERVPTMYRAESASLEENQVKWEQLARQMVADLADV